MRKLRLTLLAVLAAAVMAAGALTQAPTLAGSGEPEQRIAGSKAEQTFGRESS